MQRQERAACADQWVLLGGVEMKINLKFKKAVCPFCGAENFEGEVFVYYSAGIIAKLTDSECDHSGGCKFNGWWHFGYPEKSVRYTVHERKVEV